MYLRNMLRVCIMGCSVLLILFISGVLAAKRRLPLWGKVVAINAGHNRAIKATALGNGDGIGAYTLIGKEKLRYPGNPIAIKYGRFRGVIREADLNQSVALLIARRVRELGGRVVFARVEPCKPTYWGRLLNLKARAALVNRSNADFLIDLHANSHQPQRRGYMLFVPWPGKEQGEYRFGKLPLLSAVGQQRTKYQKSLRLANLLDKQLKQLARRGGIPSYNRRPIYSCGFKVVGYVRIPAVLIEMGFMDRKVDMDLLASYAYRKRLAQYIVQAILRWYNKDRKTALYRR